MVALAIFAGGCLSTSPAVAALKAIWGPGTRDGTSLFPTYQQLGVRIYEDALRWDSIAARRPRRPRNPNDPAYAWPSALTQDVAEANRHHMRVALELIGAPKWSNGRHSSRWAPRRPRDFADFAVAAARRYPGVHLWMIWGEPSRAHNFQPLTAATPFLRLNARQRTAPPLYARLLDAAYGALKRVGRANVIVGGMTDSAASISTPQWIENMRLPNGKPPRLDLYGHNPFSIRAPNLLNPPSPNQQIDFSDLARLDRLVDDNLGRPRNREPGLFLSEWTIPTAVDREFNFHVDPGVQAQWIADGLRVAGELTGDVYALGWIHLYDELPQSAGGLIEADGRKKPGYLAWQGG